MKAFGPEAPDMDEDDIAVNPARTTPMADVLQRRLDRRSVLRGTVAATLTAAGGGISGCATIGAGGASSSLTFEQPDHRIDTTHHVADGYSAKVLIRWGDRVLPNAADWDPNALDPTRQARQFGYNNDFMAFVPLPRGSTTATHGLLFVNHEYTNPGLMFAGHSKARQTVLQSRVEMAAMGGSVIEVQRTGGFWRVVEESRYARRITVNTQMRLSGPAAGDTRLQTGYDRSGRRAIGTLNNCAGGKTPWGTVLMAEENFHYYFGGHVTRTRETENYKRYGIRETALYPWNKAVARFDLGREPNEPKRFGWMVEVDPYDPASTPVKRTALGRFKHEGATCVVNKDGRLVVYSGDDQYFEYLYRFVSRNRVDPAGGAANRNLLDDGTLYVARFDENSLRWIPLTFGTGPLTPANGFESQADVLIETRRAADLLEATPMDRPEDVEPNPVNGNVYLALTKNGNRKPEEINPPNPRAENRHGHVLELVPPGGYGGDKDHAADVFAWEILFLAGNPQDDPGAHYHPDTTVWLSSPDNVAFDPLGRLWISSDQGGKQIENNIPDGMYACDVEGPGRALIKFFFGVPRGAEMCGPEFTPDGTTLFVAVQHPGEEKGSTFESPSTRWPDFAEGVPPRPSVVAITKDDGGLIGGGSIGTGPVASAAGRRLAAILFGRI